MAERQPCKDGAGHHSRRVNQDFLLDNAAAREFRAITMMYQAGICRLKSSTNTSSRRKSFRNTWRWSSSSQLLEDAANFPNNPDIDAQKEGFANAADRDAFNLQEAELEHETEQAGLAAQVAGKDQQEPAEDSSGSGSSRPRQRVDPGPPGKTTPAPKPPKGAPKPKAGATGGK
jgi:hypothetical protein